MYELDRHIQISYSFHVTLNTFKYYSYTCTLDCKYNKVMKAIATPLPTTLSAVGSNDT